MAGEIHGELHEVSPRMRRLGVLWDYAPPAFAARETKAALDELRLAATRLGVAVSVQMVRTGADVQPALVSLTRERIEAVFVTSGRCTQRRRRTCKAYG